MTGAHVPQRRIIVGPAHLLLSGDKDARAGRGAPYTLNSMWNLGLTLLEENDGTAPGPSQVLAKPWQSAWR